MDTTYINRYADIHLSYHTEKYTCDLVHKAEDIWRLLKIDHLCLDSLYYHVIQQKRDCCLEVLLKRGIPSSFCIVRIYQHKYNLGKYIYSQLTSKQKAKVFLRMIDMILYIPDIQRDVFKYNPTLWSLFCTDIDWSEIEEHLDETYHTLYILTIGTQSLLYYKYSEQYPLSDRYRDFLQIDTDSKEIIKYISNIPEVPNFIAVFNDLYRIIKNDCSVGDIIIYSKIFYKMSITILDRRNEIRLGDFTSLIEESMLNILKSIDPQV